MAGTAIDFLLGNLKHQMNLHEEQFPYCLYKDRITSLYEELRSFKSFLKDSEKEWYEHVEMKELVTRIIDLGYEGYDDIINAQVIINVEMRDHPVAGIVNLGSEGYEDIINLRGYRILGDVIKELESIKKMLMELYDQKLGSTRIPQAEVSSSSGSSFRASAPHVDEEIVVGFEEEVEKIKERLAGGVKQLEIISIVGMGGSGKTTLAINLYNDPFIVYHFYVRGWTYVSQEYRKRDVLLAILTSIVRHKKIYGMTHEELGEELYRRLKGKRYLIVMDDIWHINAWTDIKIFFPNDNNGSKILLTSRHKDVALHAKPNGPLHFLRFLNEDESWNLLHLKVFCKGTCPSDLVEIGKQVAKKCQGLPLAIVVAAGLLAKVETTQDRWNQVAESLNSYIVSDSKQCLDILALSYNYLPEHLKSCFLYFGTFPEDYEILVQNLIWLWIAEGFIDQIVQKSLEDVAEEYLMELIDRSLVLVAKKQSSGGIKSCRIHDLLRDFCLKKAEEENFLQQICGYEQISFFSCPKAKKQHRLSIHSRIFNFFPLRSLAPPIWSCLCYTSNQNPLGLIKMSLLSQAFKCLRVLNLSSIQILFVPDEIEHLFDLRYLAFQIAKTILPFSIFRLWNLETLILTAGRDFKHHILHLFIPDTVWNMVKLRHIHMPGINHIQIPTNDLYPPLLDSLQTISLVSPSGSFGSVLARTPNLKKLGFFGPLISEFEEYLMFPDLDSLNHLETLKLSNSLNEDEGKLQYSCALVPSNTANIQRHPIFDDGRPSVFKWVKFPPNLKKLTLENTFLAWKEMSVIGMLPNLEVLKLRHDACIGPMWETRDGEFRRLKFLKLDDLHIAQWNTSSIHFPSLQHLVFYMCQKLKEIPSNLGDIPTLEIVELRWCSYSAINSARQIQKEQQNMGNNWLKILINCFDEEIAT